MVRWFILAAIGFGFDITAAWAGNPVTVWPDGPRIYSDECLAGGKRGAHLSNGRMTAVSRSPEALPEPGSAVCHVVELLPTEFGVLSIKTGNHPERFRGAAVELIIRDGEMVTGQRFIDDRMLSGARNGRLLLIPPTSNTRRFLVITRYMGGPPMSVTTVFDVIDPTFELMKMVGKAVIAGLIADVAVDGLGFEGWKRDAAKVVAQLAIGAAMRPTTGPDVNEDTILGALGTIAPQVSDHTAVLGGTFLMNYLQALRTRLYDGFDRE